MTSEIEIFEQVKSLLPKGVVDKIEAEGCEVVVYTSNKEFFRNYEERIKEVVLQLKKRIEVRASKEILPSENETIKKIHEVLPKEALPQSIVFEPERSLVIINVEKPGIAIGRKGERLKSLKKEIFWTPRIERIPAIRSKIVAGIREVFHSEVKFRKKFLNLVGKKIFSSALPKRNWIRIICLGGCYEVGRSCMLLETPKSKLLIDCGINVGSENNFLPYFQAKEFDYNEIDAIIVSHAHLDHIGAIPALYERGYDGPLYMTEPTVDLATLLWLDFIDVLQKKAVQPFYTARGVKEAVKHTIPLRYEEVSDVAPDVRLTFFNAGHILGSALVHLHIGEGLHNILYALDQKFAKTNLLDPAHTNFHRVETLILESTYGGKEDLMPKRSEVEKQLMEVINKTMERNGIVLIPSFSVERAQELMAILYKNDFSYPVYLDGMIWDANGIFTAYPEYFGKTMWKEIMEGKNPFTSQIFKRIANSQEREKAWEDKPCIIISTSGMLIGGPVLQHLQALAGDERNTLIFVGYQASGTLGRRIQKGWREIELNGEEIKIKMEVYTAEGLSAHSDRKQLLAYIGNLNVKVKNIIVVHGEPQKSESLARTIGRIFRISCKVPKNLEGVRVV